MAFSGRGAATGAVSGAVAGSSFGPIGTGIGALIGGLTGGTKSGRKFAQGTPEIRENVSTLRPEQEGLYDQLIRAGKGRGGHGAFGTSADYYRDLLSNDSADFQAFANPALRQYGEEIVPGISEQFAGMGSGGLSSSGFRNAQIQGATDLSERLGALRANLRQQGAQGLANIGQLGLGNFSHNMTTQPGTQGFLSQAAPIAGQIAGTYFGGPAGSGAGNQVGAKSGPYGRQQWGGNNLQASPRLNWGQNNT